MDTCTYKIQGKEYTLTLLEDSKYGKQGYRRLKGSAKDRHIDFEIKNFEELLLFWVSNEDYCYWCGLSILEYQKLQTLILQIKTKNQLILKLRRILATHNGNFLTFDRLNSDKGYSVSNLVKSCLICNISKGSIINENEYRTIAATVMRRIKATVQAELE